VSFLRENNPMRAILAGLAIIVTELVSSAVAAPAPDIVGKSVLVSWTENRQMQRGGESVNATLSFDLSIYISSAGRPFTRLTLASRRGSAVNEQVGNSGTALGGGVRAVSANGHAIVFQATMGNYARNLTVELAPGGSSCSAQMVVGKEVGSAPKAFRSPVTGMMTEIHSLTVNGVSCAVQEGNVFAR
jgi:hypothetical protein